jgi:hypothetical protein
MLFDWVTVRVVFPLSPARMVRMLEDQEAHPAGAAAWNSTMAVSVPLLVTLTSYVATDPFEE